MGANREEHSMPDSFGKRNRTKVRAEKAQEREARRIARSQRRKGILPMVEHPRDDVPQSPVEPTPTLD
jgi:hypothetical protein